MKRDVLDQVIRAFLKSTATHRKNSQNEVGLFLTEEALAAEMIVKLMFICMKLASTKSVLFKSKAHNKMNMQITDSVLGMDFLNTLLNIEFESPRVS